MTTAIQAQPPPRRGPPKTPGKETWTGATMRVTPVLRAQCVEIAEAATVTFDGVVQLAIRHRADLMGIDIPGWIPPPLTPTPGLTRRAGGSRLWFRSSPAWDAILGGWMAGEVNTIHGVLRECIRAFHAAGIATGDAAAFWRRHAVAA